MMPTGLPAEAPAMMEQGADPNAERRRQLMAQLLQGAGRGGSPWGGLGPAALQLAQALGPNALATTKG